MVKRTFNTRLVQEILSDPKLLRRSGSKSEKVFNPKLQKDIYYLLALKGAEVLGLIVFHMQNSGCYQGHVNYKPIHWGQNLEKYTKEAIAWMFENVDCRKIFAFIPSLYPEIKKHSILSGMSLVGILEDSYFVDDKIYDQHIMAVSKP